MKGLMTRKCVTVSVWDLAFGCCFWHDANTNNNNSKDSSIFIVLSDTHTEQHHR